MNIKQKIALTGLAALVFSTLACAQAAPAPSKQSLPTPTAIVRQATPTAIPTAIPKDANCYFDANVGEYGAIFWGPKHSSEVNFRKSYWPELTQCKPGGDTPTAKNLFYQVHIVVPYSGPVNQWGITDEARATIERKIADFQDTNEKGWERLKFPGGVMGKHAGFSVLSKTDPVNDHRKYRELYDTLAEIANLGPDIVVPYVGGR